MDGLEKFLRDLGIEDEIWVMTFVFKILARRK